MNKFILIQQEELESLIQKSLEKILTQKDISSPPPQQDQQLIKIDDVCSFFGVSKPTVHYWKKTGIIPFHKIGRLTFFKLDEIKESLQKRQVKK